jgi:prepilin-type N-terminal cleavage/methylation domain-containing protein
MNVLKNHAGERKPKRGFTLIELLIVIAIIAILAAVAFVALDPLTRFRDARDSSRWNDITAILAAIKVDQVDNGGAYIATITSATAGTEYIIGTDTSSCNAYTCDVTISATGDCVDLTGLATEGYVGSVPISPTGATTWTAGHTGYYLIRNSVGSITVGSCESENSSAISVTR